MPHLEGKVGIVTGAGRGIGRGEALLLAAEGCRVVVNDLGGDPSGEGKSSSPADEVVAEIKKMGGDAIANYGNVASMEDGEAIVKQALDKWGRLDIVVNNAGILRDRMVFNMSEAEWDAVIAVHLKGHFSITKHACAVFRQQRSGRIVGTSSTSGMGNMGQANYSAAKEGIVGLIRTLALDMGRYGVTANAIRPTAGTRLTLSDQLAAASAKKAETGAASQSSALGSDDRLDRLNAMRPEMVAPLVVFLCTDHAANVNGRDFLVHSNTVSLVSLPHAECTIIRDGGWTVDELIKVWPNTVGRLVTNPSAPR